MPPDQPLAINDVQLEPVLYATSFPDEGKRERKAIESKVVEQSNEIEPGSAREYSLDCDLPNDAPTTFRFKNSGLH
jgi:sporulation-control protein spo0M